MVSWRGSKGFCFTQYFIRQQKTLPAVNNAIIINKKASKIYKFVEVHFVRMIFVGIAFLSSLFLSHIITELSIILPAYLPSQLHDCCKIGTNLSDCNYCCCIPSIISLAHTIFEYMVTFIVESELVSP